MEIGGEGMDQENKLQFLLEMIRCSGDISYWIYDSEGELLHSQSVNEDFHLIFQRSGCLQYAMGQVGNAPMCLGENLGLLWGAVFTGEEETRQLHVIGPVQNTEISQRALDSVARSMIHTSERRRLFTELLTNLPVIPLPLFQHYILMLYFCLTGERLRISDVQYQRYTQSGIKPRENLTRDRHQNYMAEKRLLYHIREGDLNFKPAQEYAASLSSGIRVHSDDPLKQVLITTASFTSLCTRAAIEGGLPPDTAYTVGDTYIQAMIDCKSPAELGALTHAMYEDFVRRVHKVRTNHKLSPQILACCEYVQLHMEDELTISILAKQAGYTPYYLSRKFKAEVGESIADYIDIVRIERAKMLLETTNQPISEIARTLHYCSSTYFSDTFKRITGKLPREYRQEAGNR